MTECSCRPHIEECAVLIHRRRLAQERGLCSAYMEWDLVCELPAGHDGMHGRTQ